MSNATPKRVWVVIDENGDPCYCHIERYGCEEHINDAISDHDIEEAAEWTIVEYIRP